MKSQNDWQPTATIAMLRRRAELLSQIRSFFDQRGFFEVQTPLLSRESIIDRYIDPIAVEVQAAGSSDRFYLQTSPEFGMKRLLAAGADAIYQITTAFRAGESGQRHNPEFTMLEWYRVGDSYQRGMQLLSDFAQSILPAPAAEIITYREAFLRHTGADPFAADDSKLVALLPDNRTQRSDLDRDNLLNWILAERIETNLGREGPTIVCDWPSAQAALAKVRLETPPVAERFELFVAGVELANGYHELTDADELARRMAFAQAQRAANGHVRIPQPERLLQAMRNGLPDSCGVAVGFDRLLMVIEGRSNIREVIAFPLDRA